MNRTLNPPLTAKDGHDLQVLIICRVSNPGPGKQDERSNEDQEAMHQAWLRCSTDLPFQVKVIAGIGSGEILDREEVEQIWAELESGKYDVVLCEDLGRFLRRIDAYKFCELEEDEEQDSLLDGQVEPVIADASVQPHRMGQTVVSP